MKTVNVTELSDRFSVIGAREDRSRLVLEVVDWALARALGCGENQEVELFPEKHTFVEPGKYARIIRVCETAYDYINGNGFTPLEKSMFLAMLESVRACYSPTVTYERPAGPPAEPAPAAELTPEQIMARYQASLFAKLKAS
jgi:hypothetical protein